MFFQWIGGIALALWRSPFTWTGATRSIHPHVWVAVILGGIVISLPIYLALLSPGRTSTRHAIAVGQMLTCAILIHLGDGRIEMHFQIFGSLAFLAFYRDWRVLVTASAVVVADHLLRGIFLPQSIYGVAIASDWRTVEHAAWVVFEDIFLIGSCVQGVREMRGIADQRAMLEYAFQNEERRVLERTRQLKDAQEELLKAARAAGMAEIATSVLHNVGNVLNSVNVSATVVADRLRQSEVASLAKVSGLIAEQKPNLARFLTEDDRGKMIPDFIAELATCLGEEQRGMLAELTGLAAGIEHIKQIVAAQQSMASKSEIRTETDPAKLLETALTLETAGARHGIEVRRHFSETRPVMLDQHKVLQILVNLIGNARHALKAHASTDRCLTLSVVQTPLGEGMTVRFEVSDNGVGIRPEHLTRIFSHGFTTKTDGHGFGLHSAANAAREMGGSLTVASDGPGKGAAFTLEVPIALVEAETSCQA